MELDDGLAESHCGAIVRTIRVAIMFDDSVYRVRYCFEIYVPIFHDGTAKVSCRPCDLVPHDPYIMNFYSPIPKSQSLRH